MGAVTVMVWPLLPARWSSSCPVGAGRQVDLAAGRALFRNRSHKEGRAKHVLIAQVGNLGIEWEIERKRAHEWCTGEPGLVRERVNVGHELVAQAQVLFQNWLGLAAVGPDLVGGRLPWVRKIGRNVAYWNHRV